MTLYEFNSLTIEEKQTVVWDQGVFLDNYVTKVERINCYALHMFFVEVHYNSETNKIIDVRSFKTGNSLDRYSDLQI